MTVPDAFELCALCERIDFRSIFAGKSGSSGSSLDDSFIEPYPYASWYCSHSTSCAICFLLATIASPQKFSDSKYRLQFFPAWPVFETAKPRADLEAAVGLAFVPQDAESDGLRSWLRNGYLDKGLILVHTDSNRTSKASKPPLELRGVDPKRVNYDRCKAWLDTCELSHGQICAVEAKPRRLQVPVSCIDCITSEIKQIHDGDEYLALSYVWGTSKSDTTGLDRARVSENASQVIKDAMTVVRQLGRRYLWVDQYCVDQDSHDIKSIQIAEMDQVYAGACATIVAGAGSDANYGLPGVSRPRAYQQSSLSLVSDLLELGTSLPLFSYAIKSTTWYRRAWTYQEAILSHRCIFFTEYQAYFICPQMSRCEAVEINEPVREEHGLVKSQHATLDATIFQRQGNDWESMSSFPKFAAHVTEYSGRSLTFEGDMLNAFRALLTRSPFYSFYGIPIAIDSEDIYVESIYGLDVGFAKGLWWSPVDDSLRRIPQFPSWTWAGWEGSVHYWSSTKRGNIDLAFERNSGSDSQFNAAFWLEHVETSRLDTLKGVVKTMNGNKVIPECSYSLVVDAMIVQLQMHRAGFGSRVADVYSGPTREYGMHPEAWGSAHFFERELTGDVETWDCILLHKSSDGYLLMIIEWDGDVARRIGNARGHGRTLDGIPHKRRRIRMV
jgi:hypothetical protein